MTNKQVLLRTVLMTLAIFAGALLLNQFLAGLGLLPSLWPANEERYYVYHEDTKHITKLLKASDPTVQQIRQSYVEFVDIYFTRDKSFDLRAAQHVILPQSYQKALDAGVVTNEHEFTMRHGLVVEPSMIHKLEIGIVSHDETLAGGSALIGWEVLDSNELGTEAGYEKGTTLLKRFRVTFRLVGESWLIQATYLEDASDAEVAELEKQIALNSPLTPRRISPLFLMPVAVLWSGVEYYVWYKRKDPRLTKQSWLALPLLVVMAIGVMGAEVFPQYAGWLYGLVMLAVLPLVVMGYKIRMQQDRAGTLKMLKVLGVFLAVMVTLIGVLYLLLVTGVLS